MKERFLWAAGSLPQETVPAVALRQLRKMMQLTNAINMTKVTGTTPLIAIVPLNLKKQTKKNRIPETKSKNVQYKKKTRKKAFAFRSPDE